MLDFLMYFIYISVKTRIHSILCYLCLSAWLITQVFQIIRIIWLPVNQVDFSPSLGNFDQWVLGWGLGNNI